MSRRIDIRRATEFLREFIAHNTADPTPLTVPHLLVRDANGELPTDDRPIAANGKQYVSGITFEYHDGGYVEVHTYAHEWSSNYLQIGRGRTMAEALDDLATAEKEG